MKLRCKKCNEVFSYKTILKSLGYGYKITCPNCGSSYKVELIYRILISLLISLPLFLRLLPVDLEHPRVYIILYLSYIPYIIFILLLSPLFIKLKE